MFEMGNGTDNAELLTKELQTARLVAYQTAGLLFPDSDCQLQGSSRLEV